MIEIIMRIPDSEQYNPAETMGDQKFVYGNDLKFSRPGRKKTECLKFNNKPIKPGKNPANVYMKEFYD
jgi:hypothetical protein